MIEKTQVNNVRRVRVKTYSCKNHGFAKEQYKQLCLQTPIIQKMLKNFTNKRKQKQFQPQSLCKGRQNFHQQQKQKQTEISTASGDKLNQRQTLLQLSKQQKQNQSPNNLKQFKLNQNGNSNNIDIDIDNHYYQARTQKQEQKQKQNQFQVEVQQLKQQFLYQQHWPQQQTKQSQNQSQLLFSESQQMREQNQQLAEIERQYLQKVTNLNQIMRYKNNADNENNEDNEDSMKQGHQVQVFKDISINAKINANENNSYTNNINDNGKSHKAKKQDNTKVFKQSMIKSDSQQQKFEQLQIKIPKNNHLNPDSQYKQILQTFINQELINRNQGLIKKFFQLVKITKQENQKLKQKVKSLINVNRSMKSIIKHQNMIIEQNIEDQRHLAKILLEFNSESAQQEHFGLDLQKNSWLDFDQKQLSLKIDFVAERVKKLIPDILSKQKVKKEFYSPPALTAQSIDCPSKTKKLKISSNSLEFIIQPQQQHQAQILAQKVDKANIKSKKTSLRIQTSLDLKIILIQNRSQNNDPLLEKQTPYQTYKQLSKLRICQQESKIKQLQNEIKILIQSNSKTKKQNLELKEILDQLVKFYKKK